MPGIFFYTVILYFHLYSSSMEFCSILRFLPLGKRQQDVFPCKTDKITVVFDLQMNGCFGFLNLYHNICYLVSFSILTGEVSRE